MTTMHAVRLVEPGKPLEQAEISRPVASQGEVVLAVSAAGICRSDVHYRAGHPEVDHLPITLGHEIAGRVVELGPDMDGPVEGARVAVHYQIGCGACTHCLADNAQFCARGKMIGKDLDGGFAQYVVAPARNLLSVPDEIPLDQAAVMMCSTATALHALRRARTSPSEAVAIFGAGGLGTSAIQLARLEGADPVYALDVNPTKLKRAESLGAIPIEGGVGAEVRLAEATAGRGIDVALDLVGDAEVLAQAIRALAPGGRAVVVGLMEGDLELNPYRDLLVGEAELLGASDHTAAELAELLDRVADGALDIAAAITGRVPLDVGEITAAMDDMEESGDAVRTVVFPG